MPLIMIAVVAASLTLPANQAASRFVGTWVAELDQTRYVRLELAQANNGVLGGALALGNIEVDGQGEVRAATAAPADLTPIFDVALRGSTLSFARKDGDDTDRFEVVLASDHAELRLIPSDADKAELAAAGIPVPKPVRMRKLP